jgi:DNA-binding MarR family transcriptional regulator
MRQERRPASRDFHLLASLRVEMLARQSRRHADVDYRRRIGLGVLQCRIIGIVGSRGPMNLPALCAGADIDKTYASRLVANLTGLGFLRKLPAPSDQRSFAVALTRTGRQAYHRIFRIARQRNERWLAALLPEQRAAFFGCLDILEAASRKLAAASRPGAGASDDGPRKSRRRAAGERRTHVERTAATPLRRRGRPSA